MWCKKWDWKEVIKYLKATAVYASKNYHDAEQMEVENMMQNILCGRNDLSKTATECNTISDESIN